MKKFVVLLAVVAMTSFSAMAFAAEVTVGGSLEVRSRNFTNLNLNEDTPTVSGDTVRDTQSRIRLDVNAKAGDVKGKLQLESDWTSWGHREAYNNESVIADTTTPSGTKSGIGFREAWVSFLVPGIPVKVVAGHQLLALGNGWFFSSLLKGSDAWVVANDTGNNHLGIVNVKWAENDAYQSDDIDSYSIVDVFKLSDTAKIGIDVTNLKNRSGRATGTTVDLINAGINFNGTFGPVALKAQADFQMGDSETAGVSTDFAGNQIVVQGAVALDPVTVNFTAARGTGDDDPAGDNETFQTALDKNPHYTLINEYLIPGPGGQNAGFSNTTALNVGVSAKVLPSLTLAADYWWLMATETAAGVDDAFGQEIDVKANWSISENLAWNWTVGYFMPGDFHGTNDDDATAIVGVLAFKF